MSITEDQALVREANERRIRERAGITYTAKTWAEKWNDVAWLQGRVTELEKWHAGGRMNIDDEDHDTIRLCRGQHSRDDGCEWETYRRVEE